VSFALGYDVGGTTTKLVLMEAPATVVASDRLPTLPDEGPAALVARCLERGHALAAAHGRTLEEAAGVGVGVAGLVDAARGLLAAAPNLGPFAGDAIRQRFADAFSLPVALDNDANLWALGEALIGAAVGARVVAVLALGTGVGGGVVVDGQLLHGARGMAAEFGHMALTPDAGPRCSCGARGCLEAYVGTRAIVERARRLAERQAGSGDSPLARALAGDDASPRTIAEAARAGDSQALEVFETTGRWLGIGIANLLCALDPDAVVIGGGVALVGAPLLDAVRREVWGRSMAPLLEGLRILPAALEDQGGVLGAALLALAAAGAPRPSPVTVRDPLRPHEQRS
jgi:glucokinase